MDREKIYESVQDRYSRASRGKDNGYGESIAKAFGYSEEELVGIPKEANLGLSCGNPLALAGLREGETVLDLGSGAGFDAFLAANCVGRTGRVIGVDMNRDMLARANKLKAESGKDNVEFVESMITDIPLDSGIADCIISNCVINLVPEGEKQLAFNEMFRLLKPGGRLAISDILLKKPMSDKLKSCMALYTGCIAGASTVSGYEEYLRNAGFGQVLITDTNADLNVYLEASPDGTKKGAGYGSGETCCSGFAAENETECGSSRSYQTGESGCCGIDEQGVKELNGENLNDWAGSYKIFAIKSQVAG